MANENLMGAGEGESPLMKPAAPNVDVRTMSSDMQSINTGSPTPKPYVPQTAPENMAVVPPVPNTSVPDQSFQIPQADTTFGSPMPEIPVKKSGKGVFTAIIVFIAVVGLAALGYFVIYPIFFANPNSFPIAIPINMNPNPAPALPATEPTPISEPAPITEVVSSTAPVAPATPAPTHVSILTIPADSKLELSTVLKYGPVLSNLALNTTASPSLTEIIYKDSNGNLLETADILKNVLKLEALAFNYQFNEGGAAGMVYNDSKNVRSLGFVFQLADNTDLETKISGLQSFIEKLGFSGIFSGNPGAEKAWKSSQVSGASNHRYLTFENPGFTIDYGWVGNKLVIATSFDGFKEIIKRLQ
ncbi:MAG: hypothetical protein AAB377_01425 [Patescibacteria group bacterium]